MKKNILKKIIFLTYLNFILVSLFLPFNKSLADLTCTSSQIPNQAKTACVDCIPPQMANSDYSACVSPNTGYTLLAPIPGLENTFVPTTNSLGKYINIMIKLVIGLSAVLAVVMIFLGGIEYMTAEVISHKEHGKERITHAILGLLLALASYALLNTINPDLLNTNLTVQDAVLTSTFTPESAASFASINSAVLQNRGIPCSQNGGVNALSTIAQAFIGKSTYNQAKRNTSGTSPLTMYFDCSSFVDQVYSCAGLPIPGNNTGEIFNSGLGRSSAVTSIDGIKVNGIELDIGDLVGWVQGGAEAFGHVMMYVGNGQIIDAEGPTDRVNQAISVRSLESFKSRIKYVKRVNGSNGSVTF